MKASSSKNIVICLFGLGVVLLQAQNFKDLPNVVIPGAHLQKITSTIVGQEYNLLIQVPRNYSDTSKNFPVVYLLDAQWDFPLVTAQYGEQYYDGFIPELIIVGITWGGPNPNADSLRVRDFSPTRVSPLIQSGGGPKFLSFLKSELIPFMDSTYRTAKSDRTLVGSSFGGLFTLYALFSGENIFNKYILTSPYLGYDNNVITSFAEKGMEKGISSSSRLFMAHGELEGGVAQFEKFVKLIKSKKIEKLEMQTKILEHSGHSGTKAEGYTRGLQFVFQRAIAKVEHEILDQYVGEYQSPNGISVHVTRSGNNLIAQTPDGATFTLLPSSADSFFVKGQYLNITAVKDENHERTGFLLEQYSGTTYFSKKK